MGFVMPRNQAFEETTGDLFQAPGGSALMHACSARGAWGKGIAVQFRNKYPGAYEKYKSHCLQARIVNKTHQISNLYGNGPRKVSVTLPVGTALVIPPWEANGNREIQENHWIICLFTSYNYGVRTDSRTAILNNTAAALYDLKRILETHSLTRNSSYFNVPRIYTCRLNSGLFNVPWEMTKPLLEQASLPLGVSVVHPPEPEKKSERKGKEEYELTRQRRIHFGPAPKP